MSSPSPLSSALSIMRNYESIIAVMHGRGQMKEKEDESHESVMSHDSLTLCMRLSKELAVSLSQRA